MRNISDNLKARFESTQQTKANNADPRIIAWLKRNTTALTDLTYLESSLILNATGLSACSLAVRRIYTEPDRVYAAYIDENGGHVVYADLGPKMNDFLWKPAGFGTDADDISLAFDGKMPKKADGTSEFFTDKSPWVFWIKDGVLKGRIVGLLGDTTLATANAEKVSAIRATWASMTAVDFGLVVFFTLNGQLYYRQLIGNEWKDAVPVTFGPEGVTWTDIAAFRTWDYRIGVQAKGSDGKVYELFTQFQGVAKHGAEHINLNLKVKSALPPIVQTDVAEREHMSLDVRASGSPLYQTGAPQIVEAYNVEDNGDWGKKAVFVFDRHLVSEEVAAQPSTFQIEDADGNVFFAKTAELASNGMTVSLTFYEFNNAVGTCKAKYAPGTVHSMADVLLTDVEKTFTPQNLVAPSAAVPEPLSITNTGDTTVTVAFSAALTSLCTAEHFKAHVNVPEYSPGGELLAETRISASVALSGTDTVVITFQNGSRTDLRNAIGSVVLEYDGTGELMGEGGTVQPFELTFTPVGLTPKYDSMDAEHLELSVVAAGLLTPIVWHNTQDAEHIELGVAVSGVLTDVHDL